MLNNSDTVNDVSLALRRTQSRLRELRRRSRDARRHPLPDVLAEWEMNGHNLELRAPRYTDFDGWRSARLRNQKQIEPFWDVQERSWSERHSLGDFVDFIRESERARRHHTALYNLVIHDGVVIGEMSLPWIHEDSRSAEVSVWMDEAHKGRDERDSAFAALTDFAFHGLDLVRLSAPVAVNNPRAARAINRMGFTLEGTMRFWASAEDQRTDFQLWSLIRPQDNGVNSDDAECNRSESLGAQAIGSHSIGTHTQGLTHAARTDGSVDVPGSAADGSVTTDSATNHGFDRSIRAQARLHDLVPGGAHTYARGEDQYPDGMAPVIERGLGSRVWDLDGNCYVEYGSGLRAVTLGHAFEPVVRAVTEAISDGNSFSRPSRMELLAAEDFLRTVPTADMVKFAKNGSDATTAAIRLARSVTGRTTIAMCQQPFFSVDDWFIGTTAMNGGTRAAPSVSFPYNDIEALRQVLSGNDIAAVIMEAATGTAEPEPGYLQAVRDLCTEHSTILIFDEMITGFRWAAAGAQSVYGVTPDLSCWGKALGNGFPISALAGRRDIMEAGGLRATGDRVFLMSTTHGPESGSLAAMRAVIDTYRTSDPVAAMEASGRLLMSGINSAARDHGISDHLYVTGRPSCLVFITKDADGNPSQEFRTLTMSGLISRGVLGQSLVNSAAHTAVDVEQTIDAFVAVMPYYRKALEGGSALPYFSGRPVTPAIRRTAAPRTPYSPPH